MYRHVHKAPLIFLFEVFAYFLSTTFSLLPSSFVLWHCCEFDLAEILIEKTTFRDSCTFINTPSCCLQTLQPRSSVIIAWYTSTFFSLSVIFWYRAPKFCFSHVLRSCTQAGRRAQRCVFSSRGVSTLFRGRCFFLRRSSPHRRCSPARSPYTGCHFPCRRRRDEGNILWVPESHLDLLETTGSRSILIVVTWNLSRVKHSDSNVELDLSFPMETHDVILLLQSRFRRKNSQFWTEMWVSHLRQISSNDY